MSVCVYLLPFEIQNEMIFFLCELLDYKNEDMKWFVSF